MAVEVLRVDEVRERIEAKVPKLAGRFQTAGRFADLVEHNQVPQVTPAAFVLPGGLQGGTADAIVGLFRQQVAETIIVVLVGRWAGDATGAKALDELSPLIRDVIDAVCGWGPVSSPGVFELRLGELAGIHAGTVIYHLEFALGDQLRITVT